MTSKSPAKIQKRIQRIKAELSAIDAMRPGSLTRQYKDPKNKRGAYYQLSYTRERKSRTEYVPRPCLPEVRRTYSVRLFLDRKSTRLNSSHMSISYAVFCLKKKNNDYYMNTMLF